MVDAKKEDDYILRNDQELDRLTSQHTIIKDALENRMIRAPVSLEGEPLQILDISTANGLWIRDLQGDFPTHQGKHTWVGVDLATQYFPEKSPSNTTFQTQNIRKEWPADFKGRFDLVHQRLALGNAGSDENTKEAIRKYIELLKPGAWIQFVELQKWSAEEDHPAWKDLTLAVHDMLVKYGSSMTTIEKVAPWLKELGLQNVKEEALVGNFGTRDDKNLEKIGRRANVLTGGSVFDVCKALPQEELSFPKERVETSEKELKRVSESNEPLSAHWRYKVVFGQKPQ